MNRDRPDHLKFGYDHMVEMAALRTELEAKGFSGVQLHFEAIRRYEQRHKGDPTYAERCNARRVLPYSARPDPLRETMEMIRDGHNDPRTLAREILLLIDAADAHAPWSG